MTTNKKVCFLLFLCLFSLFGASLYSEEPVLQEKKAPIQNPLKLTFTNNATFADFINATGEVIFVNISVDNLSYFMNQKKWTPVTKKNITQAITNPWTWDNSPFLRNEAYHPYFGSLYFVSARSNNLNFLESFGLTAAGSWFWESIIEGGGNSLNDLITTTTAGAAIGEMHHRLFYSFKDSFYPLAVLASPVDFITSLVRGKYFTPIGNIYDIKLFAGGGAYFNSPIVFLNPAVCTGLKIIYENPFGHNTQELMDQFTFNIKFLYSKIDAYFLNADFTGTLYSIDPFNAVNFDSTLGLTYNYRLLYSPISLFSSGDFGITFGQQHYVSDNLTLSYKTELFYTFLGTTDLSVLYEKKGTESLSRNQQPYSFNNGPGSYAYVNFNHSWLGSLSFEGWADYFFCYEDTLFDSKADSNSIILQGNVDYNHLITGNLSLGINFSIYEKFTFYKEFDSEKQLQHRCYLYLLWDF